MLVVCKIPIKDNLSFGKTYEVLDTITYGTHNNINEYVVISDNNKKIQVSINRFELVSLVRKRKLNKI